MKKGGRIAELRMGVAGNLGILGPRGSGRAGDIADRQGETRKQGETHRFERQRKKVCEVVMCRVWLTVRRVTLGLLRRDGPDCIALPIP